MTTSRRANVRLRVAAAIAAGLTAATVLAAAPAGRAFAQPASSAADRFDSMFAVYQHNRETGTPNYITADFMLTGYALVLAGTIRQIEADSAGDLARLVTGLRGALDSSRDEAAAASRDYLAVVGALLKDQTPGDASPAVAREIEAIRAAAGIGRSGIVRQRLDYSQFRVRGEYAATPERAAFFRAVRYAGTVLFPVRESRATGITAEDADALTAQALLMTRTVSAKADLRAGAEALERRLAWLFGPADDFGFADYAAAEGAAPSSPAEFRRKIQATGRVPRVSGAVVDASALEPGVTTAQVLTGWRFLPQRVSPDAAALQQLVFDRVSRYRGNGTPVSATLVSGQVVKGFPLGNELMELLGSRAAGRQLDAGDERNYEGYAAAAAGARKILEAPGDGFGSDAVGLLRTHLKAGRPDAARDERTLNSTLAFWTRLRHLMVAHGKQSYTSSGKGLSTDPARRTAFLDPEVELYSALAGLSLRVAEHTSAESSAAMRTLATLYRRCAEIATRERRGTPLAARDADFLNAIDDELRELAGGAVDHPIVVDVHTDPASGQILLEGVSLPLVVTRPIRSVTARGAVAAHVEFKRPIDQRLTDEEWIALLKAGFEPARLAVGRIQRVHEVAARR